MDADDDADVPRRGADLERAADRAGTAAMPRATAARCGATLASGKPCAFASRAEHPDHGPLCGVHLRHADRRGECSICLDAVKPRARESLRCGHAFHRRCIRRWCARGLPTCPVCRAPCVDAAGPAPLSTRMAHFLRVLPVPPGMSFHVYALAVINGRNALTDTLRLTDEERQWALDVVYQSFTQDHFLQNLRVLFG